MGFVTSAPLWIATFGTTFFNLSIFSASFRLPRFGCVSRGCATATTTTTTGTVPIGRHAVLLLDVVRFVQTLSLLGTSGVADHGIFLATIPANLVG